MQLDAAVLAFDVEYTKSGRLIINGVIESIEVQDARDLVPFQYFAKLTLTPEEARGSYVVGLKIFSPDGLLGDVQYSEPFIPVINPFDAWGYMNVHIPLQMPIALQGIYLIELLIDGEVSHTLRLQAHKP